MYIGYTSSTFLKLTVTLHLIQAITALALITHTDYRVVNMIVRTKSVTIYFFFLMLVGKSVFTPVFIVLFF